MEVPGKSRPPAGAKPARAAEPKPKPARKPAAAKAPIDWHKRYLERELGRLSAMEAGNAVTAEHVRDVILKDLDRRTGRDGDWQVEAVLTARDSWLFKAWTPLSPGPLAVKVYCAAVPDRRIARHVEILRQSHEAMPGRQGATVPAPWAAIPEHRTLIMEWIDHPRMDQVLRRTRARSERDRIVAAAGQWLRRFHDQNERSTRPLQPSELVRPIDSPLGREGAGATVRDPAFQRAYAALQRHAGAISGTPLGYARSHGDFTPNNMFYGGGRTVGFDISGTSIEPVAREILHFLAFADFERPFMARNARVVWSTIDRHDLQAFLAAYGPTEEAMDERLLGVFRLAEALRRWSFQLDRLRRGGMNVRVLRSVAQLRAMASDTAAFLARP